MAEKIVWSNKFRKELRKILEYLDQHNQSNVYSTKLIGEIVEAFNLIRENNRLGKEASMTDVRIVIVDKFLLFYKITSKELIVLAIFDGRRNPSSQKMR
ncbi:MAG: type II toxin-antitoxin system RelE/ParE family toxin [Bacteroidetes bacterium]|nr:type II toxin-antitoxin system RelE/ParE family toxin [Bacteroidota bacterium]